MQAHNQEMEENSAETLSAQYQAGGKTAVETVENGDSLRVTPEEIALAAAALEAKRDAESSWHETTLPIEEAIQHLGLNATPQELAPEVVALRAARSKRAAKEREEQGMQQVSTACGIGVGIGLGLPILWLLVAWIWSAVSDSHRPVHRVLATMKAVPIQKLATVPDNVPVHIDVDTLLKLAKGDVTQENVSVDTRAENGESAQSATMFNNEWSIVKSQGVLLVNGWATMELALNISNDSAGALFSARPGWLPTNTLVPVQVPVFRLEKQDYDRYLPDGKAANSAANSVLMAVNVAGTPKAVEDLVQDAILQQDANLPPNDWFLAYAADGWGKVDASLSDGVVHLTGKATTLNAKKLAGEAAADTVKRLHFSYPISNKLEVGPNVQ